MIEALLLHGETRPLTCLPARATSAASEKVKEGLRWGEANRSLWPNSEVHEEFLPAMPVLVFLEVQTNNTTTLIQIAIGTAVRVDIVSAIRQIETTTLQAHNSRREKHRAEKILQLKQSGDHEIAVAAPWIVLFPF